ncbi:hypothetical protein [Gracilimonas amylolytica]|uniref:hypothetical protein n=1 Tax=Gracilimonas amylolytica TaxID=1749045 RepID=UPI0013000664|nr:hypothetical protein [Gracilimonas amylolytica]
MHESVEHIIDKLMGAVKADKPYYVLKDLLAAGFPSFIVERIRIEINEKIKKEYELKESDWVDTEEILVEDAFNDLRHALFANSRIPKDKLYKLTGEVITDIVKVYLEPRHHMADYIYKGDDELSFRELIDRTEKLTIYKHFGRAIPLYMQKRGLQTLEKKRCKLLIHNLDANLVASYTAKEWAQVLELLFTLFGGQIDAKLIQLFFEDKGLYLTAKAFNELDEEITKERFTEILSYPDLLDVKLQEKFRDQFREELIAQKNRFDQPDEEEMEQIDEKEQRLLDSFFGDYTSDDRQLTDQESFNELFKTEQSDKSIFEEFEETPDAEKISKSIKEGKSSDEIQKFRKNLVTVLDQAAHSFKNLSREEGEDDDEYEEGEEDSLNDLIDAPEELPEPVENESEDPEIEEEEDTSGSEVSDDEDELIDENDEAEAGDGDEPMWRQFLRPDQMDVLMGGGKNEAEEELLIDEDTLFEESSDDGSDESIPELSDYMIGQEKLFIKKVFGGKKKKYHDALSSIQELESWNEASDFLQEEVFRKYNVEMLSDPVVDFTDKLQSYFDEFKNQ